MSRGKHRRGVKAARRIAMEGIIGINGLQISENASGALVVSWPCVETTALVYPMEESQREIEGDFLGEYRVHLFRASPLRPLT